MIFTFSFLLTLTFDLFELKFAPHLLVSVVISIKFEVCTALRFHVNRRHRTDGQTDGRVQHLMRPPREGHITLMMKNNKTAL